MAWYFGSVRIFPQEFTRDWEQIIARLNPIGGGTVLQIFGYDEQIAKVNAYVVSNEDIGTLESFTTSGTTVPLTTPYGTTQYYLKRLSAKEQKVVCQTLRPDLPTTARVFIVDMELYYDG